MKLQLVGTENVQSRGGYRHRCVFETPNGYRVVKVGSGYYPVGRDGHINMNRRFVGKIGENEMWETNRRRKSVTLIEIESEAM